MDNRAFRISLNVFCGAFMTWLCAKVGRFLLRSLPDEVAVPWCAFLFCVLVCAWMWVYIASSRPDPFLKQQKEMATAMAVGVLSVFGGLALGITLIHNASSEAVISLGWILIAAGFVPIPWMLRKLDLI